ncbi:MAG: hypothetical protein FWH33_09095 [Oscillospiraceae bacterium]|nr:hypothetical protein [Oscillospiraceae bacterium]
MILAVTLKILCDICFYLAFANTIASLAGGDPVVYSLPFFAVAVYLSTAFAPKGKIRYASLILLPAIFLVVPITLANAAVLLPVIVYTVISVRKLTSIPETFSYNRIFFLFLKLYLPFMIAFWAFGGRNHLEAASLLFAFVFLVLSVMLMRMLRHTPETLAQRRFKIINISEVVVVVAVGVALGTKSVLSVLGAALRLLYLNVISPLLWFLFTCVVYILTPLFNLIGPFKTKERPPIELEMAGMDEMLDEEIDFTNVRAQEVIKAVLIIIGIALAILLIIKLFKRIMAFDEGETDSSQSGTARSSIPDAPAPHKRRHAGDNHVRAIYKRFIIAGQRHGIDRLPGMTTADYKNMMLQNFDSVADAETFRNIYIDVRYGEKEPGKDDPKKMRDIFTAVKKNLR